MKKILKKTILRTIKNDFVWNALNQTVLRASQFTEIERNKYERECGKAIQQGIIFDEIKKVFPDLVVKHGTFAGMKYPKMESVGSALFPKLLGSYEKELEPLFEEICRKSYTEIVDVGCAEGYYAVGLAVKIPTAKVFAYDTNEEAISLCRQMAELNGVGERVETRDFCDAKELQNIKFTEKALIVSDCEGYEKELFTKETAAALRNHDLLIETHDFIDITISDRIRELFETTHNIKVIESIDDIKKARTYDYPEIRGYDLATKKELLAEHRPSIMEWFFLESKNAS